MLEMRNSPRSARRRAPGLLQPLAFVGPLSPPIHGYSMITTKMRNLLVTSVPLLEVDTSPSVSRTSRMHCMARTLAEILLGRTSGVYVGFSGGPRQLLDLAFLVAAKLAGSPIYVHHHTFAYLERWVATTWINMLFMRRAVHIVLCDCMADALSTRYAVPRRQIVVVSNAAFMDLPLGAPCRPVDKCLSIGFFSNITAEKGIFDFFRIVEKLRHKGAPHSVVVAGPLSPGIKTEFDAALKSLPHVQYLGGVYGERKERFLRELDVLVFPTLYRKEAEPVSILEALSHGVTVAAYARGCIPELMKRRLGIVVAPQEDGVSAVADWIGELMVSPEAASRERERAIARASELRSRGTRTLRGLRRRMAGLQ